MTEQQIFAKCARRLIPFMMLLMAINYIDRVNVGFAALTMNRDLGFSPSVFGFGAGIFFFSYALFEVPANVILARMGARRWMFTILAIWGVLSAANALVRTPVGFYGLRFLLGVAESGLFPGMIFYLTLWFPQEYRARHTATFFAAVPLALIFGAPLSGFILGLDGVAGLHGWQWLFLIEGLPAFLIAFVILGFLPDGPALASWLSTAEKEVIAVRLAAEAPAQHDLWAALRDPRLFVLGLVGGGFLAGFYGSTLWLPQIVQAMGFSNFSTGLFVAVPYLVTIVPMVAWGRSSDSKRERIWHIAVAALISAAGFAVAGIAPGNFISLIALTFAIFGVHAAVAPLNSLPSEFLGGEAAAGGIALYGSIANLGGFLGPTIIGILKQETGGYGASMVALSIALILSAAIVLALGRAMAPRVAVAAAMQTDA